MCVNLQLQWHAKAQSRKGINWLRAQEADLNHPPVFPDDGGEPDDALDAILHP